MEGRFVRIPRPVWRWKGGIGLEVYVQVKEVADTCYSLISFHLSVEVYLHMYITSPASIYLLSKPRQEDTRLRIHNSFSPGQ